MLDTDCFFFYFPVFIQELLGITLTKCIISLSAVSHQRHYVMWQGHRLLPHLVGVL